MNSTRTIASAGLLAILAAGLPSASAAPPPVTAPVLTQEGERLRAAYEAQRTNLLAGIVRALPPIDSRKTNLLHGVREALKKAEAEADAAGKQLGALKTAEALVGHAKGKWIGGADKGIAAAEAALKKAATPAEREAATKDLAHWQADRAAGVQALAERQAAYDQLRVDAPKLNQAHQAAQTALGAARSNELQVVQVLLGELEPLLSGDRLDAALVRCTVLTEATPRALATFAQQSPEDQAQLEKGLADGALLKDMLQSGGARDGRYGEAFQIYAAIQQASPHARTGLFQRLALATSLEHAVPIKQNNALAESNAPMFVDPVKRYLHYEKAWLDGELDPAFKDLTAWEYRLVVEADAPDAILAWGREMLRTYRPDHIHNPDYGWRYSMAVRTDVPYGSQNVKDDLPELNGYQNMAKNGGVCGRRAFFGRFLLRSFGIPVWGVTQQGHAALSHWTPKGWVVNLGAGFPHSWWDRNGEPRSGTDFLIETQARAHGPDYWKVLRARWVSCVLGETPYNDRRKVAGGWWSNVSRYQAAALAAHAVVQGPLGEELGEANESPGKQFAATAPTDASAPQATVRPDGSILVPAAASGPCTGPRAVMKSYAGGQQIHGGAGLKARYEFDAPQAGTYRLSARVATLQNGQTFRFTGSAATPSREVAVPYTRGLWQQTSPVELALARGRNVLDFEIRSGSRGVTIKDFTLTPLK